ncbi:MAG: histidine kinase [Flavobacterium sp.]|nr:MAG: histidine kinase [Flavobacterium sp.]
MIVTYLVLVGAAVLQYGIVLTLVVIPLVIACYYLLSSWNSMRRSQMPIVVGFLASFICLILFVLGVNYLDKFDSAIIFVLAYSISPPLGMLMYVSNRFGEMIKEVRTNAQQVLQLSEEKREQALNQQKVLEAEVDKQTAELRNTLSDLKATQSQLIQSEKMASLGELTAGIAHEIQNPLNFVNNFSDVSRELIAEVSDERRKTNDERDDELVNELLSDIDQNLEKISHHGRRADAIVKGMLQHSRSTSGDKEPTDLNALTDEYLRLAYHGLRAKDKSFNAELITDFATDLPVVKVIPQDVGRVILNLITNAFYATQERAKSEGVDFKPKVEVSTSVVGNTVEIKVKDNGNGIPEAIKEKIFQPFFTTKPTGEGTGLGLSLAYDIIKSHGGELGLTSKDGEFTEFTITFHQLI